MKVRHRSDPAPSWIVCQIGAREHYAIAAELHRRGRLAALCTDTWVRPSSAAAAWTVLVGTRGRSLRERYAPDLMSARVISEPLCANLGRRSIDYLRGRGGWDSIMAANEAFDTSMSEQLRRSGQLNKQPVVFAYSYGARRIFETAKEAGCMTVLGQIDPGPFEAQLVTEVALRHGFEISDSRPPDSYWANWRLECELADWIVVNSSWSCEALIKAGISRDKIRIIPLSYATDQDLPRRNIPDAFTPGTPLSLLFLGQINIRKGCVELLQAMQRLIEEPVQLSLVGQADAAIKDSFGNLPNVAWLGPCTRSATADYYRAAEAFVLPTHSDGFALTQLEAASHGLPLIVSTHCGDVVKDGQGGIIVEPVSTEAIEAAIRRALQPGVLKNLSKDVGPRLSIFSPERIVDLFELLAGGN